VEREKAFAGGAVVVELVLVQMLCDQKVPRVLPSRLRPDQELLLSLLLQLQQRIGGEADVRW
jgi:hypothetical protein